MGREDQAGCTNTALRSLLDEAGMSNAALARAVVTAGAEEGVHVGTNTTSVRRMLDGSEPRWPVPRLVAKVLSRTLHREIGVTECGFADRSPTSDDRYDGLQCAGTLDGTVRTVVELSGRDMDRRKFLLGSTFTAAAFSEPALFALTVPPAENTSRVSGRRIGMPDVEIITENIAHLRRLDHRYGSGRVREQVVQTDLATAHLVGRDYEHAAILGRDAVRTAVQVSSTRTLDRLRTLQRQVHLLRINSKHLGELDERITDLLTRNRDHRDEHTTIS